LVVTRHIFCQFQQFQEPPTDYTLAKHKNTICTPHIGASTIEAQQRVAEEIAEQIVAFSENQKLCGNVNN